MPFTTEQLEGSYGAHGGFVRAWNRATGSAVCARLLVADDARHLLVVGAQSDILRSPAPRLPEAYRSQAPP